MLKKKQSKARNNKFRTSQCGTLGMTVDSHVSAGKRFSEKGRSVLNNTMWA